MHLKIKFSGHFNSELTNLRRCGRGLKFRIRSKTSPPLLQERSCKICIKKFYASFRSFNNHFWLIFICVLQCLNPIRVKLQLQQRRVDAHLRPRRSLKSWPTQSRLQSKLLARNSKLTERISENGKKWRERIRQRRFCWFRWMIVLLINLHLLLHI